MVHRREHLCSASQLWLPHPALCIVPPECFQGLRIWSGAVGSKSGKLRNIADHDNDLHDSITQRPSSHPADAIGKQSLCLMSWNIQTWLVACSKLIQFPLDDPRVCSGS